MTEPWSTSSCDRADRSGPSGDALCGLGPRGRRGTRSRAASGRSPPGTVDPDGDPRARRGSPDRRGRSRRSTSRGGARTRGPIPTDDRAAARQRPCRRAPARIGPPPTRHARAPGRTRLGARACAALERGVDPDHPLGRRLAGDVRVVPASQRPVRRHDRLVGAVGRDPEDGVGIARDRFGQPCLPWQWTSTLPTRPRCRLAARAVDSGPDGLDPGGGHRGRSDVRPHPAVCRPRLRPPIVRLLGGRRIGDPRRPGWPGWSHPARPLPMRQRHDPGR